VTCARTDANYIAPSAFGLGRIRQRRGDPRAAIDALDLVPPTSRAFAMARRERADVLAATGELSALGEALRSIEDITLDPVDVAQFSVEVLEKALDGVSGNGARPDLMISGIPATEPRLQAGLEAAYRRLARYAPDRRERIRLVDRANAVRPWSLR
jgi:serine/threonine-protein kinase PknG